MRRTTWDDVRRALASRAPGRVSDPVTRRAAVAILLRERDSALEMLFIRRAEHPNDPWSGQMAFPGGRAEPQDSDLRATAVRETAEEIGLDLSAAAEYLGSLDEVRAMARMRPMDLAIAPFVFQLTAAVELRLSSEVRSVHWLPLDELLGPSRHSTLEYVHQGTALQFPCLRVEELVIWGLTYRMFSSFRSVLLPEELPGGPAA
jgi:8-oxo-dGTP pyrophosphatase MutT (NUDIX family)